MFSGDACLPGGSKDKEDASPTETALREAAEEVNLSPSQVEVICTLPPPLTTVNGLTVVVPVVALAKCTPEELILAPNPTEVQCLYWVPLEMFLNIHFDKEDTRPWWKQMELNYVDPETDREHHIYGFTALVCIAIAGITLDRSVNCNYKPPFILEICKKGDVVMVTHCDIALNQREAAKMARSKL